MEHSVFQFFIYREPVIASAICYTGAVNYSRLVSAEFHSLLIFVDIYL